MLFTIICLIASRMFVRIRLILKVSLCYIRSLTSPWLPWLVFHQKLPEIKLCRRKPDFRWSSSRWASRWAKTWTWMSRPRCCQIQLENLKFSAIALPPSLRIRLPTRRRRFRPSWARWRLGKPGWHSVMNWQLIKVATRWGWPEINSQTVLKNPHTHWCTWF